MVKGGHQRRPLASRSHVSTPKVRYRGNAGAFCDYVRIAELQGEGSVALRRVANGLAMAADSPYGFRGTAGVEEMACCNGE
jgi:hypothetical protein